MIKLATFLVAMLVGTVTFAGSPQKDVKDAEAFLANIPYQERDYIKFFSISNIPLDEKIQLPKAPDITEKEISTRKATEHILNFTIHSLSSRNLVERAQRINKTDIFCVDIRNYGWTKEAFDQVSQTDPYYREPWIEYGLDTYGYHKIFGNYILRADWFITHLLDTTKQLDIDEEPLYYVLLYANHKAPKNIKDFREIWGFNAEAEKTAKEFELITGTNIDFGESGVSRHNRQLAHARTQFGYYWETSDVKNNQKKRDYVENLQPGVIGRNDRDATEGIATNPIGLQVYFLGDAAGDRVEFADNTVVIDRSDRADVRVRVAKSCIICHTEGINPAIPALKFMLERENVELRVYDEEYKSALKSFYLSDLGAIIEDDNKIYFRAMQKVNGLHPAINTYLYKQIYNRYLEKVDLDRAIEECGIDKEQFILKVRRGAVGRLGDLLPVGEKGESKPIPRESWDDVGGGDFAQAMILINNIKPEQKQLTKLRVIKRTNLMVGHEIIAEIKEGIAFEIILEKDGWFYVQYEGVKGYIYKDYVQLEYGE